MLHDKVRRPLRAFSCGRPALCRRRTVWIWPSVCRCGTRPALDRLLSEIYDPASTNYHRYLTPEQFAERFGPTEQDYQSLIKFAKTNGLTVTATHTNRALLDVSGSVATIEKVFHATMFVYQHPTEKRTFYAPDREPSIDFDIPILDVTGLDNFELPRPADNKRAPP